MTEKMTSSIKLIKLDTATFHGEKVDPTYVNLFSGRTEPERAHLPMRFRHPECLDWETGVSILRTIQFLCVRSELHNSQSADYGDLKEYSR